MHRVIVAGALALALAACGTTTKTAQDWDRDLSTQIASGSLSGEALADAYLKRGSLRLQNKDFDGALADYDKAVEATPRKPLPYYVRAAMRRVKGDLDGAIADYAQLIAVLPADDPSGYVFRADVLVAKAAYKDAVADYDHALQVNAKYWIAQAGRGNALAEMGDNDKALADLDQALANDKEPIYMFTTREPWMELSPKGPPARGTVTRGYQILPEPFIANIYLTRGKIRLKQKQFDEARAEFDHALAHYAKFPEAKIDHGLAEFGLGQCDAGIADLRAGATDTLVGLDVVVKQQRTFIDQTPCAAKVT